MKPEEKTIEINYDSADITCRYALSPESDRYEIQDVSVIGEGMERYIHFNKEQMEQIADVENNTVKFTAASAFVRGDLHEITDLDTVLNNLGNVELTERQKEQVFSFLKEPENICHFGAFQMEAGLLGKFNDHPVVNLKDLHVGFNYNKNGQQQTNHILLDVKNPFQVRQLFSKALDSGNGKEMAEMLNGIEYCLRHPSVTADMNIFYDIKNELCAGDISRNPVINDKSEPNMLVTSSGLKVPVAALEQKYPDALLTVMENHQMDAFLEKNHRIDDAMEAYLHHEITSGVPCSYEEFRDMDILSTIEWNVIDDTILAKKMDGYLELRDTDAGNAYFYNVEEGQPMSFKSGLYELYDGLLPKEEEVIPGEDYDRLMALMEEKGISNLAYKPLEQQMQEAKEEYERIKQPVPEQKEREISL